MTTFLIEAVVLCALFHLEVWLQSKREPARIVYSYPPAIVERYIELGKIPDKKNPTGDVIATIIMTFSSFGYYGQIWFNRAYTYECAVEEMPAGYADGLMAVSPFWALPVAVAKVSEQGTHEELVAAGGLYARMWADYNQAVQWKISAEKEGK